MKSDTKKNIMLVIGYIAIIIFVLIYFNKILSILGWVINIFSPFLLGILIAFVLNVLVSFIENKLFGKVKKNKIWYKLKRSLSITISLVLVTLIIVFIINLLIPQLKNSVSLFTDSLPGYKEDILDIMNKFDLEETTITKASDYLDNFSKIITDYIKGNSKDVITVTTEVATSIVVVVSKTVIALVFAIYMIAQKETLKRQLYKLMNAYLKPKTVNKISKYSAMANKTFSSFVTGQCLEAIIFGLLSFIGMLILGLPYASTISVLLGFTALIPVFGAFIGTGLGAFLILMVSPVKALIFIIFVLVLQQIEGNLIYPRVVGKSVGLPGIWVLLSVTIGASVGGILGMLIATPLCSLLYTILTQAVNDRINSNKIVNKVKEKA